MIQEYYSKLSHRPSVKKIPTFADLEDLSLYRPISPSCEAEIRHLADKSKQNHRNRDAVVKEQAVNTTPRTNTQECAGQNVNVRNPAKGKKKYR